MRAWLARWEWRGPHKTEGLLFLGLWIGLTYGVVEGFESTVLGLIPGALSWRTGNSLHVLWFAPTFYGVTYALAAIPVQALAQVRARIRWDCLLVFLLVAISTFLSVTLPGRFVSDQSAAILGVGVGSVAARMVRDREGFGTLVRRTLPYLLGVVVLAAVTVPSGYAVREMVMMRRLPKLPPDQPNVLLLVLDTQRADHLSAYGYSRRTTPVLDALSAGSTWFESAWASSSWTLPSHGSLFTGQTPHEHHAGELRHPYLDGRFPTLAEVLRRQGYATGGFVANTFWCGRQTGLARGFVRFEDFYGSLGDAVVRTVLGRRLSYDVFPKLGLRIDVPGRKRAARLRKDLLSWVDGLDGRPFFAFVNFFDVHGPYLPPKPFAGRFSHSTASAHHRVRKIQIGQLTGDVKLPPLAEIERMRDAYDESLLYLDSELGKLFQELRSSGLFDNTILIVTADHGESWGEHGFLYHGHSLYQEQIRVPLLLRFPGVVQGGIWRRSAVSIAQIPVTITALLGMQDLFPGRSLLAADRPDPAVLSEVDRRSLVPASWPSSRGWVKSIVSGSWHYLRYASGEEELFDWKDDPREERNRASDEELQPLLRQLEERMDLLLKSSDVHGEKRK